MSEEVKTPGEPEKVAANVDSEKFVPKEDFEKLGSSKKELETQLDEAKMSLLDPEYLSYLESKRTKKAEVKDPTADVTDADLDSLSSKQLLALAIEKAKSAIIPEVEAKYGTRLRKQEAYISDILGVMELKDVEGKHKDFDQYRDATKKVLETSQTPLTIEQAYKQAKYDAFERGELKKEPEKPGAPSAEKPAGNIPKENMQDKDFKTPESAADDAWNNVVGAGKDTL